MLRAAPPPDIRTIRDGERPDGIPIRDELELELQLGRGDA